MATVSQSFKRPASFLFGHWGMFLTAVGLTIVAYLGVFLPSSVSGPWQVILCVAALIVAGAAIAQCLQSCGEEFEDHIESAGLVFLCAMIAEAILATMAGPWDTICMFLRVLSIIGVVSALILLLPSLGGRLVISLLLLFHFCGILTAITAVEPPNAPAPWLALQAWTRIYRPYLSYMYLNNAYHFYSPEPGPPTLAWFRMHYADNSYRWVKIPVREESPIPLHYQRMLAFTESINQINANPMSEPAFEEKLRARRLQGNIKSIPLHPLLPPNAQYRQPSIYSQKMLSSYARFAARHFKHLEDPSIAVTSVRIYRVTHNIILPSDLALGYTPLEKTLFMPYYQGEFDLDGNLQEPNDPFLYWLLPIFVEETGTNPSRRPGQAAPANMKVVDCLEIHGGSQAPTNLLDKKE